MTGDRAEATTYPYRGGGCEGMAEIQASRSCTADRGSYWEYLGGSAVNEAILEER